MAPDPEPRGCVVSLTACLFVTLGGAVGSLARYLIAMAALPISRHLPWGTIAINIAGSFVIAFFGTLTLSHGRFPVSENARLFVMVGFCGGFTTFSSFSLQTFDLMRSGAFMRASVNVLVSVPLCLAAVALGHVAASRLNGDARPVAQLVIEEET